MLRRNPLREREEKEGIHHRAHGGHGGGQWMRQGAEAGAARENHAWPVFVELRFALLSDLRGETCASAAPSVSSVCSVVKFLPNEERPARRLPPRRKPDSISADIRNN